MNIPARYCTGYLGDIGVPPPYGPMDFAAWFEAFLDGHWYTFDARNNTPRIGRVLIARGRDASDVAISSTFGPNTLDELQGMDRRGTHRLSQMDRGCGNAQTCTATSRIMPLGARFSRLRTSRSEKPMNTPLPRKTSIRRCPSCGALVAVLPDMERFACKHCAAEQVVIRQDGTTSLKCVAETI